MGKFARRFEPLYKEWRHDIFKLCEAFRFEPSWQQRDFLQAVQIATHGYPAPSWPHITKRGQSDNLGKSMLAVKSGQGPGKTSASTIAGGFRTMQYKDALTMVTAPTMDQCREVWLSEFRRRLSHAHPALQRLIRPTKSRIIFGNRADWAIKFVTAVREQNAQGRHEEHMTWIAEEASGILRALMVQVEGTLSNTDGMFILVGNPNTRDCYFFDCFNMDRHHWWTYTMNAEEAPEHIVSKERNQLLLDKYGRESDIYRVRVLGEFPHNNPNCVISSEDLEACTITDPSHCMRFGRHERNGLINAKQFGIDFARFGGDENVIYQRFGNCVIDSWIRGNVDPNDALDKAFEMRKASDWKLNETWFVPDAGGMGQGLMRRIEQLDTNYVEFHNGGRASDPEFNDKITEAWFTFAKLVKARQVHIPNDPRLIQQLSTRQYKYKDVKGKGKICVESKEDYVFRMRRELGSTSEEAGKSPDRADAMVMCFYNNVEAVGRIAQRSA